MVFNQNISLVPICYERNRLCRDICRGISGSTDGIASVSSIGINTILSGNAAFGRKISRQNKDKYGKQSSSLVSHQAIGIMSDDRNSISTTLRAE
jgi:hypothetical protein